MPFAFRERPKNGEIALGDDKIEAEEKPARCENCLTGHFFMFPGAPEKADDHMASGSQLPRAASAPCHACLLRGDERKGPNARASWRRICDDCAEDYMTPLLVPTERVRLCPESFGTWGQSREIFQSWDTGMGTTVPARKYILKTIPDGNVAVVFQDAGDASAIDQLLGPLSVQLDKPLALRYCSSIKSFCSEACFASSRDKSCLAHVKPRRAQDKMSAEQQKASTSKRTHAELELRPGAEDESWLFDDILSPDGQFDEEDGISVQSLSDICADGIYSLPGHDAAEATLESLLIGAQQQDAPRLHSPMHSSDSEDTVAVPSVPSDKVADSRQQKALQALWNEGADSTNIMSSLGNLLGDDGTAPLLSDPTNELWAASAVDVLDETFKSFSSRPPARPTPPSGMKQKPKIGRPPLGAKPGSKPHKSMVPAPTGTTPSTTRPPPPIAKRQGANTSKMQNMKMACLPQQQAAPKPPASQKGKCVWKQLVTYW